jgi:hypothetical protein
LETVVSGVGPSLLETLLDGRRLGTYLNPVAHVTPSDLVFGDGWPATDWLRVGPDDLSTKRQLEKWVGLGATYARSLPAKR